jgi:hypothetical protein
MIHQKAGLQLILASRIAITDCNTLIWCCGRFFDSYLTDIPQIPNGANQQNNPPAG